MKSVTIDNFLRLYSLNKIKHFIVNITRKAGRERQPVWQTTTFAARENCNNVLAEFWQSSIAKAFLSIKAA